jgi:uncharacterized membrane protein
MARTAIDHPIGWTFKAVGSAMTVPRPSPVDTSPIVVNRIGFDDLTLSLKQGFADFAASRTDVILLCIMYPIAGIVFSRLAVQMSLLPMVFPLLAGFALLGPVLASGTYNMSRVRERTGRASWTDAFAAFRAPGIGSMVAFGLWLLFIFALWLIAAHLLYKVTLGRHATISLDYFIHGLFITQQGRTLIWAGIGTGAIFAAYVLSIGIITAPLLLDRNVGLGAAIRASFRATRMNLVPVAAWGAIVAALLAAGTLVVLIGLAVVVPVLGHATWHLYRKLVVPAGGPE